MSLRLRCSNGVSACYPRRRDAVAIKRLSESHRQREKRPQCGRRGFACGVTKVIYSDLNGHTESPTANSNGTAVPLPVTRLARRVVLKISGEALQGRKGCGINPEMLCRVAEEIATCHKQGYQIAVVVGGGNFFRGADAFEGIDRVTADYVGMLATVMNAACLQSMVENFGVESRLQTALDIREVAEPYVRRKAIRHLEKGRVVIFGAGTGSPFFTTDMTAAMRAGELNADELLKATKVDGVYSCDPSTNENAELLEEITYDRALKDHLQFMDVSALALCKQQSIPVHVFNLLKDGNISKAIKGEHVGTVMTSGEQTVAVVESGEETVAAVESSKETVTVMESGKENAKNRINRMNRMMTNNGAVAVSNFTFSASLTPSSL